MAVWIPKGAGVHTQNADGENIDRGSQVEFNIFLLPIGRGRVPDVRYITDCEISIYYSFGRARAIYGGSGIDICVLCNIQAYYIIDDDLREGHEAVAGIEGGTYANIAATVAVCEHGEIIRHFRARGGL